MDTMSEYTREMTDIAEIKAVLRFHEARAKALRSLLRIEGNEKARQTGYSFKAVKAMRERDQYAS